MRLLLVLVVVTESIVVLPHDIRIIFVVVLFEKMLGVNGPLFVVPAGRIAAEWEQRALVWSRLDPIAAESCVCRVLVRCIWRLGSFGHLCLALSAWLRKTRDFLAVRENALCKTLAFAFERNLGVELPPGNCDGGGLFDQLQFCGFLFFGQQYALLKRS